VALVLLKGHGGSVAGGTVEEATARAIMEEAATIQLLAAIAGKILSYQPDELSTFKQELEQQKIRNERPGGLLGLGVLRVKGM